MSSKISSAGLAVDDIKSAYDRTIGSDGGAPTGSWTDPDTGEVYSSIGLDDLALINKFQRMIDPATVRKDDFDNIIGTEGTAGRIRVWVTNLVNGVKLSPNQRAEIVALSREFHEAQLKAVDEDVFPSLEAMRQTFNGVYGENAVPYKDVFGTYVQPEVRAKEEAELLAYRKEIAARMFPNSPESQATVLQRTEGMTKEEIDDPMAFGKYSGAASATTGSRLSDLKRYIADNHPTATVADLAGMSEEALKRANPSLWAAFDRQYSEAVFPDDYNEVDIDG